MFYKRTIFNGSINSFIFLCSFYYMTNVGFSETEISLTMIASWPLQSRLFNTSHNTLQSRAVDRKLATRIVNWYSRISSMVLQTIELNHCHSAALWPRTTWSVIILITVCVRDASGALWLSIILFIGLINSNGLT